MITQENIPYTADEIKAMVKTCEKYNKALERAKDMLAYKEVRQEDMEYLFPELEGSKDESIRKSLINFLKSPFVNENITDEKVTPWIAWLKKQGEKKPTDKITPKFKVGDWITNGDYIWKIVEVASLDYILQSQDGDIVDDTISYVDEQFHSFTIEDAKDGDVLINWNNTTFIFKAIEDKTVKFHIAYNENWDTIKTPSIELSHLGLPEPQFEFRPAFKEQRDLLFQKMKEAGYEWDLQKKEVKKIEVTSKESKDERIRKTIYGWIYTQPSRFFDNGFSKEEMLAWVEKQKGD